MPAVLEALRPGELAMTDALLFVLVVGVLVLALGVDVGTLLTWMMQRWKP